ncbi:MULTISPECIES: hypothetical protein [unclassified Exiguobacterium]|uniref:hypothetical protein n=1 Tax=unclassified Exiguobacterium TaxID=2644629 RepID=UPI00103D681E|nr:MULTISPECIES: hypothetical protein [unclassified Exiguobacterium]TCI48605.1 hypothetical protein EVJ31_06130 [Exiguobacterium sp. SH5S32]TCI55491.1 hypothetical protein EVJ25_06120 [Exiguobacterium sp. SH1S4]TCI63500.1 hypothetical protein EVJ21_08350 [Exiguobacterium sp. SH0S2]TCI75287.1 hypothetical protein EVJ23_06120 [Exiguobacterium sp. SH1S1]
MKQFLGKCIEYSFVALVFIGLFFGLRYGVHQFVPATEEIQRYTYLVLGTAVLVFPASLFGGYFLARPIQRRLNGTATVSSNHVLRGDEKPHGVTEDRNGTHTGGGL